MAGAILLSPLFAIRIKSLHERMKNHYAKFKNLGYPFGKIFPDNPPASAEDIFSQINTYFDIDEILALLRGYETFLKQIKSNFTPGMVSEPYEFIEAFEEEDLEILEVDSANLPMQAYTLRKSIRPRTSK